MGIIKMGLIFVRGLNKTRNKSMSLLQNDNYYEAKQDAERERVENAKQLEKDMLSYAIEAIFDTTIKEDELEGVRHDPRNPDCECEACMAAVDSYIQDTD